MLDERLTCLMETIKYAHDIDDLDALIIASSKVDMCRILCEGNAFHVLAILSGIIDRIAEKLKCPREEILRWMIEEG